MTIAPTARSGVPRPPDIPAPVAAAFAAIPPVPLARLMEIRALIFAAADAAQTGPLTETLKWGEPAYLTGASKSGTTIRLGWKPSQPDYGAIYVNCQTDLVDRYRQRFPTEFTYQGDRAVLVPVRTPLPAEPLHRILSMALTYHRDKRRTGTRK